MNASYEWLKDFCPTDLSPIELRDRLTSRCATVEEVLPLRSDLAPIVVARVAEASRHPDSDHLWVTKVDDGSGTLLDVVCGAPNVEVGQRYPFARTGVLLPGGLKIERRKIRGAVSNGMLCSARELGLGEDQAGILALDTTADPGTPLLEALPVGDVRLGVDVLPNRPDLLSHLGIAREIAALSGVALRLPAIPGAGDASLPPPDSSECEARAGAYAIRVDDADGCPRYMAALIRGVTVGPSPDWLATRLAAVGARPINNIVDATNYMLHGFGQPMHAFDARRLGGSTIIVRRARPGERLTTLDGVERALDPEMTVIADADRAQAIAGVMGGGDSEVGASTTDILLEVAAFEPTRIRRTRRTLAMSTDASYRFERGVDVEGAPIALAHAMRLIVALAGGRIEGVADVRSPTTARPLLEVRIERIERLLGVVVPPLRIAADLRSIGFGVEVGGEVIRVTPPSWRSDVRAEVDVIEEVARLHGYDALPDTLRPYRPTTVPDAPLWRLAGELRHRLSGAGLLEIRPMPFVAGDDATHVRVANPLAENEAHLRTSILETLARRAEHNLAHMQGNVRLFEIGAVFAPSDGTLPVERTSVGMLVMGERRPSHFTEPRPPRFDEWDAKGLAEVGSEVAYPGARIELVAPPAEEPPGTELGDRTLWHVRVDGSVVGRVVRLRLDAPVWAAPAYAVELSLGVVQSDEVAPRGRNAHSARASEITPTEAPSAPRYRALPPTPSADVDLALLVPDGVEAAAVESIIRRSGGELLERIALFDEFRGSGIPAGHRSVAWRLTFRDPVRTLRDKEVEGRKQKILRALEGELSVRQRTA